MVLSSFRNFCFLNWFVTETLGAAYGMIKELRWIFCVVDTKT